MHLYVSWAYKARAETAVEEPALAGRAAGVRDRRCADGLGRWKAAVLLGESEK